MTHQRVRLDLSSGWQFALRKPTRQERRDGLAEGAEPVDLPHSWNGNDTFLDGVRYYQGPGTYSCTFRLPHDRSSANQGSWVLRTEGFYGTGELWLDGRRLAKIDGQYLGVRVALPDDLEPEHDHRLVITITNRCAKHVLPGHKKQPDFVLFGGLAGRIELEFRPATSIEDETLVVQTADELDAPRVDLQFRLAGRPPRSDGRMVWTLTTPSGEVVSQQETPLPQVDIQVSISIAANDVELWTPDQPALYILRGELFDADLVVDSVERRIGFRQIHFDRDGFWLNGERLFLAGFNRHEWMPGQGNALTPEQHGRDAELIKEYGANFVRLSHYPQHPSFLDRCDELGLLVYAEIATWKSVRGGRWLASAERQLRGMIARDHHHPGIILWGMGNESQHRGAYLRLDALARQLDPTRPTTYAENHLYRAKRAGTLGIPGVWSINYELDKATALRDASKTGCIFVSEVCNDLAERGDEAAEAAQVESMKAFWKDLENYPFIAGYLLWSFNDYPTLFRDRYRRTTGKFDSWRQPKAAAEAFRAKRIEDQND